MLNHHSEYQTPGFLAHCRTAIANGKCRFSSVIKPVLPGSPAAGVQASMIRWASFPAESPTTMSEHDFNKLTALVRGSCPQSQLPDARQADQIFHRLP